MSQAWYRELSRYHWFVLSVAAMGWLFDCLDQQLFILAREPAMRNLLAAQLAEATPAQAKALLNAYSTNVTSIFLIGWATGGLVFGVLADRFGRSKTMVATILLYSLFTGLSALSTGYWDFAVYRFLTGLGVGGEFAVGVALVAEVMPQRARPYALALLQALSTVGNVAAAGISLGAGALVSQGTIAQAQAWRWMFVVGAAPALLAVVVRWRLKEPERWTAVVGQAESRKKLGSYFELFGNPDLRRRAIVGLLLASAGVIGLWGIGFFSPELLRSVLRGRFEQQGLSPTEVEANLFFWVGITMIVQNVAGFFGMYGFGVLAERTGRRPAFALAFLAAAASTILVFWQLKDFADIFWMIPLMGFCQFSLFGGYAVYFPELFPTRLRSTGTSFCYNVGRYVAATGPYGLGLLTSRVYSGENAFRYAGMTMCSVFAVGLVAILFAPETKGQPLPE